jgi:plasmid stabilization system protein ParE
VKYKLIVTDDAKNDIQKAYDYLELCRTDSGDKLMEKIEDVLSVVVENPEIYSIKYNQTRQVRVKPFQYLVLYKLYGNSVLFFQLFHEKQDSLKKKMLSEPKMKYGKKKK